MAIPHPVLRSRNEAFARYAPSTAPEASIKVPPGTAPTSPEDGDLWTTALGLYVRINGVTVGPLSPADGSPSPSNASPLTAGTAAAGASNLYARGDHVHPATVVIAEKLVNYVLVLTDVGKVIEMNVGGGNTLTVPEDATVNFPIGTSITVTQTGAGQTTLTPAGAVTINATPGLKLSAQWAACTLIKRAANTWIAIGSLVA